MFSPLVEDGIGGEMDCCHAVAMDQLAESKFFNQMTSRTVVDSALYSDSAEEQDTVSCFVVFQKIGELPNCINQPVKDLRVIGQPEKSASHHTERSNGESDRSNMPWPGLCFRYRTTLRASS